MRGKRFVLISALGQDLPEQFGELGKCSLRPPKKQVASRNPVSQKDFVT